MTLIALTAALALAAAPPPKAKPAGNDTMKNLLKDAVTPTTPPAANPDGGAAEEKPGPNVAKMQFTPESIKTVVAYYQPQIQSCYEETLAVKNKAVEGKLVTEFVISPDGTVKKPKISAKGTTLKDPKLHDCVIAVLSSMNFPQPPDGKDHPIAYPFNLKAIQ